MIDPSAPSACGGQPVGCSAVHPSCRCRGAKNGKKRQKTAELSRIGQHVGMSVNKQIVCNASGGTAIVTCTSSERSNNSGRLLPLLSM